MGLAEKKQLTFNIGQGNWSHKCILRYLSAQIITGRQLDWVDAFLFALLGTLCREPFKMHFWNLCWDLFPREVKWRARTSWIAHWAAENYLCRLGCPPRWQAGTSCLCSPHCCQEGWRTHLVLCLLLRLQPLAHLWHQGCHCKWQDIITKSGGPRLNFSWGTRWLLCWAWISTIVNGMSLDKGGVFILG